VIDGPVRCAGRLAEIVPRDGPRASVPLLSWGSWAVALAPPGEHGRCRVR
jgi:hypothetical protein